MRRCSRPQLFVAAILVLVAAPLLYLFTLSSPTVCGCELTLYSEEAKCGCRVQGLSDLFPKYFDTPLASCPPLNRTRWSVPDDFDARSFCAQFNERPRGESERPRIFYGAMFGYEFDMLEVLLQEISPVVDKIIVIESTSTHSLSDKPLQWERLISQPRFAPFLHKIANYSFTAYKKYRSGWDIEKRQRRVALRAAFELGIRDGDIFIGNMDLDEIFSAKLLMRYKFCNVRNYDFSEFHFRYNVNCLQDPLVSLHEAVVFPWSSEYAKTVDLYKLRLKRSHATIDPANLAHEMKKRDGYLTWHLSTFGSVKDVIRKLQNSPHRFLGEYRLEAVVQDINDCVYDKPRSKVVVDTRQLPYFIQQNLCYFMRRGWVRQNVLG